MLYNRSVIAPKIYDFYEWRVLRMQKQNFLRSIVTMMQMSQQRKFFHNDQPNGAIGNKNLKLLSFIEFH